MIELFEQKNLELLQCQIFCKNNESEIIEDIKKYQNIQKLFGFEKLRFDLLGKKSKLYQLSQMPGFKSWKKKYIKD